MWKLEETQIFLNYSHTKISMQNIKVDDMKERISYFLSFLSTEHVQSK